MTNTAYLSLALIATVLSAGACVQAEPRPRPTITAFGDGGQLKMLYDRRQRPQSIYLNGKVHLVYNGGGPTGGAAKSKTKPMALTYDPATGEFSAPVELGPAHSDHHYGPIIWADTKDHLHVLFGCHKTPGTHLRARQPGTIGSSLDDWEPAAQIAPSLSYPTAYRVHEGRELLYYRTGGHISSWTYRLSADEGKTWAGPATDVVDLDSKGRFEWASYQTKLPSADGTFLHVAFIAYDDNRDEDPKRFYNARYGEAVTNQWKYNLYYVKIDLRTHVVTNFEGRPIDTPLGLDQADAECRIWDTEGRGAGVPPDIALDRDGNPTFLHVLSGDTLKEHQYYYVRRANGRWKKTPITHANHQWNSCHLRRDDDGTLHAYLIVGDGYFDSEGYMDKHGGGDVEEWISTDEGDTWTKRRDLTPDRRRFPGWRYNNLQPVTRPDGSVVEGMLLFYGWKDPNAPEARGFLVSGL